MGVREELLSRLEARRGEMVPGGALARELGVSRNAVWKAADALRREGFGVEAVAGGGYRLSPDCDRLSAEGICPQLSPDSRAFYTLTVEKAVDSTNLRVKALAAQGAPEGTVLLAEGQSAGRGRLGRSFYSAEGDGLYMSVLLRPRIPAAQALRLTTAAAVAVCDAIWRVCGVSPAIKWVNDVLLEGRKVCGILTEGQVGLENGEMDWAVIGVGINVRPPEGGYPPQIRQIAGALYTREELPPGLRCRLAAAVLDALFVRLREQPGDHLAAYREKSAVLGKEIEVLGPEGARRARALSIEPDFSLQVVFEDGERRLLSSGEVRTRLAEGAML